MKKLISIFISIKSSVILLVIFAASIGYATFVENQQGTEHAKELIYNAKWFEIVLFLLIVNLIGIIIKNKLISRKKWSVLLFHVSFICILIGSSITRYIGYEGIMHIREGETSNYITTGKTAVKIVAEYNGEKVEKNTEVRFSPSNSNKFVEKLQIAGKTITVENKLFVPNAVERIEQSEFGEPVVGIFIMSGADHSMDFTLFGDEKQSFGDISFAFAGKKDTADILFVIKNNELFIQSNRKFSKTGTIASGMIDRDNAIDIMPGSLCAAEEKTVYRVGKLVFMISGFYPMAIKTLTPQTEQTASSEMLGMASDALIMQVNDNQTTKQLNVFSVGDNAPQYSECLINDVKVSISYGKLQQELPFSITLRKFELERYQGSMSPSSYASEITVTDTEMKSVQPFRIYMNNILNYRGYRFFQSSYDNDEKGTVLSVNHDFWGTLITYIGYFFMLLGMVLTLFSKNSRFRTLLKLTSQIQEKRKLGMIVLLLGFGSMLWSQQSVKILISKNKHIEVLKGLLIQDVAQGRIEPFCTYASDVLRKIYKHNTYKDKTATEVILEMSVNAAMWKNEPIIKISNPVLEKELGAINGYISFNQVFDVQLNYKLSDLVEKAYQKEESARNKYEKELINLDERINICNEIYMHNLLAIFPNNADNTGKWLVTQAIESNAKNTCPHLASGGSMSNNENELIQVNEGKDSVSAHNHADGMCTRDANHPIITGSEDNVNLDLHEMLLSNYFNAVSESMNSGNWSKASQELEKIKQYQIQFGGLDLPSASKIKLEIAYNDWDIFIKLMIAYGLIGFVLIILHFIYIFNPTIKLEKNLNFGIYPLYLLFLLYSAGLIIRWYISGHAPWSNGYESMIFVGWASSLSGFLFARKSPLAFAVTALLSSIALSVAAMSWMNPEITNLVPVLKSYWLVIHVAIITSSYGFLAMAAILGFLNLILMVSRSEANSVRIKSNIQELAYIQEMAMIIGLFMLTVGTFLGGIWANESWGRYWGWDSKETWALVSVLVYAIILHLRMIPKLNNPLVLSTMSVVGFSSILMTFLGVNYYLSGMHSYGKGTPPPFPFIAYIIIIGLIMLIYWAFKSERKNTIQHTNNNSINS